MPSENYWFRRHEAAYHFARPLVARRRIVEVGCGEGYGAALLAVDAALVLGVDYDAATVAHARSEYPQAAFVRANLAALPVATHSVDVVVTLQVIEHVWNHPEFVHECHRVLIPGGTLLVSTPNRLTFSPGLETPMNPFHTHEFTAAELTRLLVRCGFEIAGVHGLHAGPRLHALDDAHDGFVNAQLAHPPETWAPRLASDVTAVGVEDFAVTPAAVTDIDASLDLLVVAHRPL